MSSTAAPPASPPAAPAPAATYVQVFGKIAGILDVLAAEPGDLGLTQVATRARINKATTHRLLATLVRHGYVEPGDQPGTYRLGMHLFRLGAAVQRRLELRQVARPVLVDLAQTTEETASLVVLADGEALCVDRVEGKHANLLAMQIGTTLPLHAGAASRVLLAHLSDGEIATIVNAEPAQLTRFTEVQPARMWELIQSIRRHGYAVSDEDVALGVAAIAAPIRDATTTVVGAISVSGSRRRLNRDRVPILAAQVTAAARRITAGLVRVTPLAAD